MQTCRVWYYLQMKIFVSLFVVLCLMPATASSAKNDFIRALYVGMRGEDVRELQKFLNTDNETRVAGTGFGSPGNETDYFGIATKQALIKFQEKYRMDVLEPFGLTSGTGFLGARTREKISALIVSTKSITISTPIVTLPKEAVATSAGKGEVIVMFPSQYSGKPGTMISIAGAGFTATDNIIYFGDSHAVAKAVSWNGQTIMFKVPDIPKGIYSLFVKNSRGDSNKGAFFIVTDGVTHEPKIESISPLSASRGETLVINGSGFTTTGNILQTGVGVFENIPSIDGMSISFVVPMDIIPTIISSNMSLSSSIRWVHVMNENGVSNAKSFTLDF